MKKNRHFLRDGIRFHPDGTTEILGDSKLGEVIEEILTAPIEKKNLDLWGNISVGQLANDIGGYDQDDESIVD